jgi:hypothetical protein
MRVSARRPGTPAEPPDTMTPGVPDTMVAGVSNTMIPGASGTMIPGIGLGNQSISAGCECIRHSPSP